VFFVYFVSKSEERRWHYTKIHTFWSIFAVGTTHPAYIHSTSQ